MTRSTNHDQTPAFPFVFSLDYREALKIAKKLAHSIRKAPPRRLDRVRENGVPQVAA